MPIYRAVIEKIRVLNLIARPDIVVIKDGKSSDDIYKRSSLLHACSEAPLPTTTVSICESILEVKNTPFDDLYQQSVQLIDISLRSTRFSFSIIRNNGQVKQIVDDNHPNMQVYSRRKISFWKDILSNGLKINNTRK